MSYPLVLSTFGMRDFAEKVDQERQMQLRRWGDQHHPLTTTDRRDLERFAATAKAACQRAAAVGRVTWQHILLEEVWEALAETDPDKVAAELIQVAAVCHAITQDLPRQGTHTEMREEMTTKPNRVTEAEMAVLRGAAMGLDTNGIAQLTGSAVSTVKTHLRRLMTKFNSTNRTQMVIKAVKEGVITISGEETPHPALVRWSVEVQGPDGEWRLAQQDVPPYRERVAAYEARATLSERTPTLKYRIMRLTTTFDVDDQT